MIFRPKIVFSSCLPGRTAIYERLARGRRAPISVFPIRHSRSPPNPFRFDSPGMSVSSRADHGFTLGRLLLHPLQTNGLHLHTECAPYWLFFRLFFGKPSGRYRPRQPVGQLHTVCSSRPDVLDRSVGIPSAAHTNIVVITLLFIAPKTRGVKRYRD